MATTRTALRQWIGDTLGDYRSLTATANGSTTTFIDAQNLTRQDDAIIGQTIYFTSGTNAATERRITDNTESTGTVTFVAVTASTATSDTAELWNDRGTGVKPSVVHAHINRAIAAVERNYLTEVTAEFSFDGASPVTELGQGTWVGVVKGGFWEDSVGARHRIPGADMRIDRANRTFELLGDSLWMADGRTIIITGYTAAGSLSTDASTTNVDAEYIVNQVCAWILGSTWHKRRDSREAKAHASEFAALAAALRPAANLIPIGNTVMLA